jgi:hypothetical protein
MKTIHGDKNPNQFPDLAVKKKERDCKERAMGMKMFSVLNMAILSQKTHHIIHYI